MLFVMLGVTCVFFAVVSATYSEWQKRSMANAIAVVEKHGSSHRYYRP